MTSAGVDASGRRRAWASRPWPGSDAGAASILGIGILVVVVTLAVAIASASTLLLERHRLGAAADAAALAAADTAAGVVSGSPCTQADRLARANGSRLDGCRKDGTTVTVRVSSDQGAITISATATAGQPEQRRSVRTVGSKK